MLDTYRILAQEFGIESKVVFSGQLDQVMVDYYYSIADIFVHSALFHEPFGITLLETMAHKVPILVSNVGSLSNIVKDAGIVFDMGSVEDLEEKLSFLIADRARMTGFAEKCNTILSDYADSKVLRTLVRMYESIANS